MLHALHVCIQCWHGVALISYERQWAINYSRENHYSLHNTCVAQVLAADSEFLESQASQLLTAALHPEGRGLDRAALLAAPLALQRRVV